jgi:ADP-ribose pyrophosphatase
VFTEVIHLYLATRLSVTDSQPEAHEVFRVEWRPLAEALQMVYRGELRDSKSVLGLMLAAQRVGL